MNCFLAIVLMRLAVRGFASMLLVVIAELVNLIRHTVDEWLDKYDYMSRWRGRDDDLRMQLEGCIRRYRYSGSFLRYVFWTLHCAGRGLRPLCAYSLDDPVGTSRTKRGMDYVTRTPQNEIVCLRGARALAYRLGPTLGSN